MCGKLLNRLPECIRYAKQQVNFWRDLSWHMTVGHARDWLTLHSGMFETAEGMGAFVEKRPVDYAMLLRRRAQAEYGELAAGIRPSGAAPRRKARARRAGTSAGRKRSR